MRFSFNATITSTLNILFNMALFARRRARLLTGFLVLFVTFGAQLVHHLFLF